MRLILLTCLAALSLVAARAAAAPTPDVFRLTITAVSTSTWDHTGQGRGLCATTLRSEGLRVVRFTSRRPTLVRFVQARSIPVDVRNLVGAASVSGRETVTSDCGSGGSTCAKTTVRFADGRVRLIASGTGRVTVEKPTAAFRRPDCPLQPEDIAATPLGVPVGPLRISSQSLSNARIAKITLTGSRTRRTTYGDGEDGESVQRSKWTLTFVRTGR